MKLSSTYIWKFFYYLVLLCGALLILITLGSLFYNTGFWYLQVLNFPRLQTLIALVLCLILFLLFPKKFDKLSLLFICGLVGSIIIQAYIILPYTPIVSKKVSSYHSDANDQDAVFSIIVVNVKMKNNRSAELLDILEEKQPTFILAMEVNDRWMSDLKGLKNKYLYRMSFPVNNTYGMALFAKTPFDQPKILFFNHDSVPAFTTTIRLPNGASFQLLAVHPVAPVPSKHPENTGKNEKEVGLLKAGYFAARQSVPVLVAGDFNDVGWSHNTDQFEKISGLNDIRIGRGFYSTFDARSSIFRWPLDYVYVSDKFKVVAVQRLRYFGSDHFPFYAELILEK